MKQTMTVLTSSETNEWYTPKEIIYKVTQVIGPIELDPASAPLPQRYIQAARYYTIQDDGLSKPWEAWSLFLNPPYGKTGSKSNQDIWMTYLISQLSTVRECIALTKTVPGYVWWDTLFRGRWPGELCITEDRLSFINSDGYIWDKSKAASSLWYYGANPDKFKKVFTDIGRVLNTGDKYR